MTVKTKKVPNAVTLFAVRNSVGEVEIFEKKPYLSKEPDQCWSCNQTQEQLAGSNVFELCESKETDRMFPWLKDLGPVEVVELELVFVQQTKATLKPIPKKKAKKVVKKKAITH